jgi:PEP-CTERM motif
LKRPNLRTAYGFAALLFLAICIPEAKADSLTFNLTVAQGNALGNLASFGTVQLDLVGSDIKFTVTAAPGLTILQVGFNGALNPLTTISVVSALPTDYSLHSKQGMGGGPGVPDPNNSFGGFGSFDYGIDGPNNSNSANDLNQLVFTVSTPGGFTSVHDLFQNNASGFPFAARLADSTGAAFVAAAVPEPGSLILLGTGTAALGLLTAYRRKKSQRTAGKAGDLIL